MEDYLSFSSFFHEIQSGAISTIIPDEYLARAHLEKVFVGQSRDVFSVVELNHSVFGVCSMFGSFIKFVVSCSAVESEASAIEAGPASKRRRDENGSKLLPANIAEKNRKDKLYNAIITFLSENQLGGWREPDKYGKPFVADLCNVLWFVDGHHMVFSSRSCAIPSLFSGFNGYNRPELSKHRKSHFKSELWETN